VLPHLNVTESKTSNCNISNNNSDSNLNYSSFDSTRQQQVVELPPLRSAARVFLSRAMHAGGRCACRGDGAPRPGPQGASRLELRFGYFIS
jgi:hypothetical protein